MEIRPELTTSRYSVAQVAEMLGRHPSHIRRLWKQGVFPKPKKTASGRPYFDDELLKVIEAVMKSGIGLNGEEVLFYRRRARAGRRSHTARSVGSAMPATKGDPYILGIQNALAQLGVPKDRLELNAIQSQLEAVFGNERPDLETVLRELSKRLLA
jgi:DNA-binding transcriptional MerR regulator